MNYDREAETEWVEVSCNEKNRYFETISNHVKKGSKLLCRGKNRVSAYVQRDTGKPIPVEAMYLNKMVFLDSKDSASSTEVAPPVHSENQVDFAPSQEDSQF
jgi:single-stranded DNA-binding protein